MGFVDNSVDAERETEKDISGAVVVHGCFESHLVQDQAVDMQVVVVVGIHHSYSTTDGDSEKEETGHEKAAGRAGHSSP